MFDPSSITHFIDRIGREASAAIFDGLTAVLLRLGLLSPEMYMDSSVVKANVSEYGLAPSGMTEAGFNEQAVEVNGLYAIAQTAFDGDGVERKAVRYFQSPDGRMPLNPSVIIHGLTTLINSLLCGLKFGPVEKVGKCWVSLM